MAKPGKISRYGVTGAYILWVNKYTRESYFLLRIAIIVTQMGTNPRSAPSIGSGTGVGDGRVARSAQGGCEDDDKSCPQD